MILGHLRGGSGCKAEGQWRTCPIIRKGHIIYILFARAHSAIYRVMPRWMCVAATCWQGSDDCVCFATELFTVPCDDGQYFAIIAGQSRPGERVLLGVLIWSTSQPATLTTCRVGQLIAPVRQLLHD